MRSITGKSAARNLARHEYCEMKRDYETTVTLYHKLRAIAPEAADKLCYELYIMLDRLNTLYEAAHA